MAGTTIESYAPKVNTPNHKSGELPRGDDIPEIILRCQSFPPFICSKGKDHCPKSSWRRKHIKEWLYFAAWHGCLPCVQHCIEVLNVDEQVESDNLKYTVMDWGQWTVHHGVEGAGEVLAYLTLRKAPAKSLTTYSSGELVETIN